MPTMNDLQFAGLFETHITITLGEKSTEEFVDTCNLLGVKPVFIQLPSGKVPSQPMTAVDTKGTLDSVKAEAYGVVKSLEAAGFPCIRVKIEAAPFNEDLPKTSAESEALPSTMYFEYHVKTLLDAGMQTEALAVAKAHNAHLSLNAFKTRPDGLLEKFFTKRMYGIGLAEAKVQAQELSNAINGTGTLKELKNVLEYCVFDTDSSIDEDWFDI